MIECPDCKGEGTVPLLVSVIPCKPCKGQGKVLSEKERTKQKSICDYIKTPKGRKKLAAAMAQPIRGWQDYPSNGRKTFDVNQLPEGAFPKEALPKEIA